MPDPNFPFSNVYPAPIKFQHVIFPSSEHMYQAFKFPRERWAEIAKMPWREAKALGKDTSFHPDWHEKKYKVMEAILRMKFAPGTKLAQQLIDFKEPLVEWNTWHDNDWGHCYCGREACAGVGKNNLGKILTRIRDDLRNN